MLSKLTGMIVVAVGTFLLASPAAAMGGDQQGGNPGSAPRAGSSGKAPRLSIGEIASRVEAQGYRDIEEIEREGEGYEVCAKDAKGREVELTVNGSTGRVEKVEACDDD